MAARYPDYIELLAGEAPPPDSNEGYVRVYAASDASLHVLESDGTDTEIGAGGSGDIIGPFVLYASKWTTLDPTQNGPGYGVATGGTFKLSYDSVETAAIDWDATAAEVLAALDAIPALTGKIALDPDDHQAGVLAGPLPTAPISFVLDDDVADIQIEFTDNQLTGDDPVDDWPVGATPGYILTDLGFTPTVGDVIYDWFRTIDVASTGLPDGPQELFLTDASLSQLVNDNPPAFWLAPGAGVVDLNEDAGDYTNFTGFSSNGPSSALVADTNTGNTSAIPAVCKVSVPLRFYYRVGVGPPIPGLVARMWIKTSTPVAP